MKYRKLGQTNIDISVVALGTWAIGGGPWWGESSDHESIKAIQAALDQGVNLIDTAPGYGFGRSEEVVGKSIRSRREKAIIATKCGFWWENKTGSYFFNIDGRDVYRSLQPRTIKIEVENSLRRLGTDYIDLLFTHWQAVEPEKTPIAETMECLIKLKSEGKIKAIGVSNATIDQIEEYLESGVVDACQPKYSLLDLAIEPDLLPYCHKKGISIMAYSPLEQGLLTGKIGMDRKFRIEEYRNQIPWFRPDNRKKVLEMLASWKDLTDKYYCTLGQLVIAWTVVQKGITCAICGARSSKNAIENAGAGRLTLTGEDADRMRYDAESIGNPS